MRLNHRIARLEQAAREEFEIENFTLTTEEHDRVWRLIDNILANPEDNPGDYEAIKRVMGMSDEELQTQG